MESTIVPVLDDDTIKRDLERVKKDHPNYIFDTSIALDGSHGNSKDDHTSTLDLDWSDVPACDTLLERDPLFEVEAMRTACASGNLMSVQFVYQTLWLDRPVDKRIDKDLFGGSGLCEAIKRDDTVIVSYLLSYVLSIHEGHFAMATEYRSYSILQLCVDRGWDINTSLGRRQPPALS